MLAEEDALRRCSAALAQRRPGEAEHIAREVLSTNPQQPAALFFLGVAHLVQGRAQEAVKPLELAASNRPEASIETHLGMALRECGRRMAEALTWLERAISRWPIFAPAFKELGATYRQMRRFADAEAVLRRGQEVAPPMPDLDMLLGAVCLDRGDPVKAQAVFTHVLAQAPGHPEALFGLGTALLNQGEFVRAAEQYRQILARSRPIRARFYLGHCLMELGRWDEGVAILRAAVKADPAMRGHVMRMLIGTAHGKFWLKRSAAAAFLDGSEPDRSSVAANRPDDRA